MPKKIIPINYTDRDFDSIKRSLIQHAQRYYPDVYKDFNQASFGSLLFDTVAYVGDVLSFYVDYQANESYLNTAIEKENIVSLSKQLGYEYRESITSYGQCDFYISVPVDTTAGSGPDTSYAPILKAGAQLRSTNGGSYLLMDDIDFSDPNNPITVSDVDPDTGAPIEYAIKTTGRIKSGFIEEEFYDVESYKRYTKIAIEKSGISEILSVEDTEGHKYYQVKHLSQDVLYVPVANRNSDKHSVPNVIKPMSVPRRFTVEHFPGRVELQFGQGSDEEILSSSYSEPSDVVMNKFSSNYVSDPYLDPTNFTTTDKMGISPSNTTLSIRFIRDEVSVSNASPGSVNQFAGGEFVFQDDRNLSDTYKESVISSLEVNNEESIVGDQRIPQPEDIKHQAKAAYAAQNRAVTKQDYVAMVYSMPQNYGSVKRCSIQVDRDSFKRNLNLYVLAENPDGNLGLATSTLKNNISRWMSDYRMMADTFDIMDAKIVNIMVDYQVVASPGFDKEELNVICNRNVQEYFRILPEIGESLQINEIYNILGKIEGVVDVMDVSISTAVVDGYRGVPYNIRANLSLDGRTLSLPHDHIYELRDPTRNIRGTVL